MSLSNGFCTRTGKIIEGLNTIEEIGEEIYNRVLETANGSPTAAEKHQNQEFAIWRLAETI
ncbi:UxaA family hydrolase [Priestia flexa]|uniref:UxaA family hydrolase n=1 Tax=Priestia flexa TaxID=86664 RepID=UPI0009C3169D|nr:UxaA family hydrolase [Priestia flexa]AQX56609.1 hypothetical protein BC359_20580 [Priestia flexa]